MALAIPFQVMHHYIKHSSILTLSYPGSRVDQLWSKLEDIAIITIILESRLSAAIFGVTLNTTKHHKTPQTTTKHHKTHRKPPQNTANHNRLPQKAFSHSNICPFTMSEFF